MDNGLFGILPERRWYIVQTYSSYEDKVMKNILQRCANVQLGDKIFQVLVPTQESEVRDENGKTKIKKTKIYPGYVFIDMILDEQTWYIVRHTPGVTGFVGSGNHPVPLTKKEADALMAKMESLKPKIEITVALGDMVEVKEGHTWAGARGPVTAIDTAKGKIKFRMDLLGRSTDTEIDFANVKKI